MLINNNNNNNSHVKFISYTGKYPNLCSGILTLEIDGIEYTFGHSYKKPKPDFYTFWSSGGDISGNYEDIYCGEWEIDVNDLPEQFIKYAAEIDEVFNDNVRFGCCGGCI